MLHCLNKVVAYHALVNGCLSQEVNELNVRVKYSGVAQAAKSRAELWEGARLWQLVNNQSDGIWEDRRLLA